MPISLLVCVRSFIAPDVLKTMYRPTVRQYHSDLSDQSALEITVRIRVRLRVELFSIFFTENDEND